MKYEIVPVANVVRLSQAGNALINRSPGMPGMGLIHGHTGAGKTTAATWFITRCRGVYVRAMATSSPSSLLGNILRELDIEARGSNAQKVERIVDKLGETDRPLFVDEADYLIDDKRLVDTLRDIHDLAVVPVVLIGMAGIHRKIRGREQLSGRIAQSVEFTPATEADALAIAKALCDIKVAEDLVLDIHRKGGGSMRLLVVGLGSVEAFAKARNMKAVKLADWPKEEDYFIATPHRPNNVRRIR